MEKSSLHHASWQQLLEAPLPASHIVQLYDREAFLAAGVARFAAEGLRRGDAVVLTGTQAHLHAIRAALTGHGVDAQAAARHGQLQLLDAEAAVDAVLADGMPDPARFAATAAAALVHLKGDARFSGVRWWGEMSNVVQLRGNSRAAMALEELGGAAAKKHGIRLLCSFLCDRFDRRGYDANLRGICAKHSHVIPAEDYVRHRLAVNRAIAEVIGEIRGTLLQSLLSWKGLGCDLPSSQALLFWIRDALPEHFDAVLSRARAYA